jgi:predicted phage tail protein
MSLRKIKLYGELAKFVGERVLEAEVNNVAQVMKFLCVNFQGIEKHMFDQHYKVSAGNWDLSEEELHYPTGQSDISIVPVVGGAGGNVGKIILGAALITAAVMLPGSTAVFGSAGFTAKAGVGFSAYALAGNIGIGLVLSGVAGLLTPVPTVPSSEQDPRRSFSFSGIQNTSRAGVAVPIVYGSEVLVGSVVISAAIETVQVEV